MEPEIVLTVAKSYVPLFDPHQLFEISVFWRTAFWPIIWLPSDKITELLITILEFAGAVDTIYKNSRLSNKQLSNFLKDPVDWALKNTVAAFMSRKVVLTTVTFPDNAGFQLFVLEIAIDPSWLTLPPSKVQFSMYASLNVPIPKATTERL